MEEGAERGVVSLFIDNLPRFVTRKFLWERFRREWPVVDMYVSMKSKRGRTDIFAFVRIEGDRNARAAMDRLDRTYIRDLCVRVSRARFQRKGGEGDTRRGGFLNGSRVPTKRLQIGVTQAWQKINGRNKNATGPSKEGQSHKVQKEASTLRKIVGEESEAQLEWLRRSIVGVVMESSTVDLIHRKISCTWRRVERVRSMGFYKFILTFDTVEDREEAINTGKDCLLEVFAHVERWSEEEICETRRVWVECFGLPVHGWTKENMRKVAGLWGEVMAVDSKAMELEDFGSFKVLIDTALFTPIKGSPISPLKGLSSVYTFVSCTSPRNWNG